MSASAGIAASAASMSASASMQASQAKRISCESLLNSFDAQQATIAEMRQYSECVQYIYPKKTELTPEAIIGLKVAIVVALIAMVVAFTKTRGDLVEKSFFAVAAPFILALVVGVLFVIGIGIDFLFS